MAAEVRDTCIGEGAVACEHRDLVVSEPCGESRCDRLHEEIDVEIERARIIDRRREQGDRSVYRLLHDVSAPA
jgi:hypothetical protein